MWVRAPDHQFGFNARMLLRLLGKVPYQRHPTFPLPLQRPRHVGDSGTPKHLRPTPLANRARGVYEETVPLRRVTE